uniref:Uncharacterized protein n=1 Tax=Arion vulgaris TaxID=1028688 RepID=A0A0B7AH37_9EUPU
MKNCISTSKHNLALELTNNLLPFNHHQEIGKLQIDKKHNNLPNVNYSLESRINQEAHRQIQTCNNQIYCYGIGRNDYSQIFRGDGKPLQGC